MNRKRILLSFVLALFVLSCVQLNAKEAEKSFLWKVETDKGTSYLLGSVHMLKKEHYPLRKVIEDAFDATDALVVEINLKSNQGQLASLVMQKGFYQGEESLKKNMSEKNYTLAKERMKAIGMDIESLDKNKPWFVAMMVLNNVMMKMGYNPVYGIDMYFMGKAEGKKDILELEGVEFQLNLFDSLTKEESESFLLSTLSEAGTMEKSFQKLIDAWLSGDVKSMEKLIEQNADSTPELKAFNEKLFHIRNDGMTKKILSYLEEGKKIFVVVGAGHMIGKTGIVQQLKDKGYKVTQL